MRTTMWLPVLMATLAVAPAGAQEAPRFDPAARAEIVDILRRALREDPTILREAFVALQEAERQEREIASRTALVTHADALLRDPADPVRGNPVGAVTVVEFFDARCGFCKALQPTLDAAIRRNRDLRVVVKDLPVLGPASAMASRALLAAQRQGRYQEYREALLRLREEPSEPALRREAERLGLDWPRLRREMDDPAIARRLERNQRLAAALGFEGTPALVVGEALVPGIIELAQLEELVAAARR